jgi:hypothetical protein
VIFLVAWNDGGGDKTESMMFGTFLVCELLMMYLVGLVIATKPNVPPDHT